MPWIEVYLDIWTDARLSCDASLNYSEHYVHETAAVGLMSGVACRVEY